MNCISCAFFVKVNVSFRVECRFPFILFVTYKKFCSLILSHNFNIFEVLYRGSTVLE